MSPFGGRDPVQRGEVPSELPPRTYLPVEQEWVQPYVADGGIPCQHIMTFTPDPNGFVALQVQFLEAILEDAGYRRVTGDPIVAKIVAKMYATEPDPGQ